MSLANPAGESNSEALGFGYDRRLMLGSVVTSDAGLLTGRKVTTLCRADARIHFPSVLRDTKP
jgi:hypothetical protein